MTAKSYLSYDEAYKLLGADLIFPDEIAAACHTPYFRGQLWEIWTRFPNQEQIKWCKENDCILLPGPREAMSLIDIRSLHSGYIYSPERQTRVSKWYLDDFAQVERVEALKWIALRKEPIDGSYSKSWQEQRILVREPMTIPNAAEVVWALTTYKAVRDAYLLGTRYVRTSSAIMDNEAEYHVEIGQFDHLGLSVSRCWEGGKHSILGVAAVRKF